MTLAITPLVSDTKAPSLDALRAFTTEDMGAVDALLYEYMQGNLPFIAQLAGHVIKAGGKRLRPMLTLASAQLCEYEGHGNRHGERHGDCQGHQQLAAAVEMIHTATLLHDDVVDESDLRRGRDTANALWGNAASVLVGDYLFSRAFQLMVAADDMQALNVLASASARIAEGEVHQLKTQNDLNTSVESYLTVISCKTAALFSAACEVGPVLAGKNPATQQALAAFGENLGLAFQIVDDVLDYSARQAELGKAIGDDFAEGKMTLPVILCLEDAYGAEADFWKRTIGNSGEDGKIDADDDLFQAIRYMESRDALGQSFAHAQTYATKAVDALSLFPDSPLKTALLDAVAFSVERTF